MIIVFFFLSLIFHISPLDPKDEKITQIMDIFAGRVVGVFLILVAGIELLPIPVEQITTGPHGEFSLFSTLIWLAVIYFSNEFIEKRI